MYKLHSDDISNPGLNLNTPLGFHQLCSISSGAGTLSTQQLAAPQYSVGVSIVQSRSWIEYIAEMM
jgi:hypothetical protein